MDSRDKQGSKNKCPLPVEAVIVKSEYSESNVDSGSKKKKEVLSALNLLELCHHEVKCEDNSTSKDDSDMSTDEEQYESYMCLACSKPFPDVGSLDFHMLSHMEEQMYLYEMSPRRDKNLLILKENAKKTKTNYLSKSKKARNRKVTHRCSICNKEFDQKPLLKTHFLLEHKEERPYKCPVCVKTFKRLGEFKRHEMIHTGLRPYKCTICEKSFNQPGPLKRHIMTHTATKPFQCDECEERFTQKEHLERHIGSHTGEKLYTCPVCAKSYARKDNLTRHALAHNSERNFKCDLCSKSFYRRDDLNAHTASSHNAERPFKCADCDKSFAKRGGLQLHTACHLDVRPYPCGKCDKKFALKHHLKKHLKTHEKERK